MDKKTYIAIDLKSFYASHILIRCWNLAISLYLHIVYMSTKQRSRQHQATSLFSQFCPIDLYLQLNGSLHHMFHIIYMHLFAFLIRRYDYL